MSYFTESFKTMMSDNDGLFFYRNSKMLGDEDVFIDDYEELKNHPLLKNLKVGGSYLTESRKHFDQYYKLINANKLMVYMLSKNNFKNFAWFDKKTWSRNLRIRNVIKKAAYIDSPGGISYLGTRTVDLLLNLFPRESKNQKYLPILITFDSNKIYYIHGFKPRFCIGDNPQIDTMDLKNMIEIKKK